MRRTNWKTVSTLVTMLVIAGCTDSVVTSPEATSGSTAPMMMAPTGSPQLSLGGASSGNTSADFTVGPQGGTFFIGNNAVVFPAKAICDPALSSYGPGTWDSPCEALSKPITIHAEVRTAKLGTWVDFTPALRFAPSTQSQKWVYLYMYTPGVIGATDISKFGILYAPSLGAKGIDEAALDPTVKTYVDSWGGLTMRRIKHFSGYLGSSGKACDPALETDCYPDPTPSGP